MSQTKGAQKQAKRKPLRLRVDSLGRLILENLASLVDGTYQRQLVAVQSFRGDWFRDMRAIELWLLRYLYGLGIISLHSTIRGKARAWLQAQGVIGAKVKASQKEVGK